MRLYFTFLTKLVVGGILLMPSVDSAVCDRMLGKEDSIRLARDHWLSTFKWEDEFVLKDGSVIRRSKHGITIEKDEIIEESQTQELFIENRNEVTLDCPLDLKMQLSRVDFLCKLCQSGLYQETKTDKELLAQNSNWESEITVINMIINDHSKKIKCRNVGHDPNGIYFVLVSGKKINLSKASINKYGHKEYYGASINEDGNIEYSDRLYPTETLRLKNKESGKEVCLSAQLSCSEFTRILFDCGHVMFTLYPPYTMQGLPNGKFAYYYYGDLEETWWIEQYKLACAAEAKKKQAEEKKREKKEALETMREKQQTEQEEHEKQVKAQQGEDTTILQNQPNVPTNRKKKKRWSLNPLNWGGCLPTGKIAATN